MEEILIRVLVEENMNKSSEVPGREREILSKSLLSAKSHRASGLNANNAANLTTKKP